MPPSYKLAKSNANVELPQFENFPGAETNKNECKHDVSSLSSLGVDRMKMDPFGASTTTWVQLDRYTKYFNVTTEEVIQRIINAATLRKTFLEDFTGRPDLFGSSSRPLTM